jgi:hypothetical protein
MDFDWKHVLKWFRNTLLCQNGILIDNTSINIPILHKHLLLTGLAETKVSSMLAPNDKQDVVLMVQLLNAIAQLPQTAQPNDHPGSHASRRILQLLGHLYRNILEAYLETTLSLHEQLTRLSTAAHLVLALYATYHGDFIPIQLFFDVMSMIKNAFMCVAKTQIDDPDGKFWLVLLGTDALKKVFGKVRTMVGNDTNADESQLANRIDGACECARILAAHPDWGGQACRLTLKPLAEQGIEITKKVDHIKPKSWKGNVHVKNVILQTSWQEGRRIAEEVLLEFSLASPFALMDAGAGYDILCPFGENKMVLVDGIIAPGEAEATIEEQDVLVEVVVAEQQSMSDTSTPQFPNMDDRAAEEDPTCLEFQRHEAWIPIDDDPTAPVVQKHKSTILADCMNPLNSKDHLKRVQGYTQYDEAAEATVEEALDVNESYLAIQDPVATLISCNDLVFVAVTQVIDIRITGKSVHRISTAHLREPNVHLRGQIMRLKTIDSTHQPLEPDWEWDLSFESVLRDIEGSSVELMDPILQTSSTSDLQTYCFKTEELRASGAVLFEHLSSCIHRLPSAKASNTFPY